MNPLLLIHGYSAESDASTRQAVTRIYGSLPADLRRRYGDRRIFELNVSRYLSLEDGLNLDDLARAMDQALRSDLPGLLKGRFDILIHSTGALLVRNWLRGYSPRPGPVERLIYLAGANFGSGWAHVGRGQLAKWGRVVFQGAERGVQLLDALELGSTETIDLHRFFLTPEHDLLRRYRLKEFCITGSQALAEWLPIPVRYAHEDGSDGVVRVSATNPGWNYVAIEPKARAQELSWDEISGSCALLGDAPDQRDGSPGQFYRVAAQSLADELDRPAVPLAIPYRCAHSGAERGVVTGRDVRDEVLALIDIARGTTTVGQYRDAVTLYKEHSAETYRRAVTALAPGRIQGIFNEPRAQYDPHAQWIVRVRDQYGRPVEHVDVLLHSSPDAQLSINELFEHTHKNARTSGILTFYLRTARFEAAAGDWVDQLRQVGSVSLEIAPTEPRTAEIRYLPLCLRISNERLRRFIQPHRTTVMDVTLLRLPSPAVLQAMPAV